MSTPTRLISPLADFENTESAVRYYCRKMSAVFDRAVNAQLWDETGREYIDFLSACGSLNYGHNHPRIKADVIAYLARDGIIGGLDLHTGAKREFLRAFAKTILAPRGLSYRVQFTGPTGTNAVEAALKLARKVTGRTSFAAFTNAFHGMTAGAQSAGGRRSRLARDGTVVRLAYDGYCGSGISDLDRFEAMVKDPSGGLEAPAAFIVETIQGEGGLNVASRDWLQHLAALALRLGSLLIVDDVQAGCGRTGDFFSFENAGIRPDMVCLAKSIGGIGVPMALLLIKPECDQWSPGEHNGTFRGNNLAFVAATAALRFWEEPEFRAALDRKSDFIRAWIAEITAEIGAGAARAKGRGLMSGIAFSDPGLGQKITAEAVSRGLLIETSGPRDEVVKLMPPITIEDEVLEEGLNRLKAAITAVMRSERLRPAA